MAAPYGLDLRKKALALTKKGMSKRKDSCFARHRRINAI